MRMIKRLTMFLSVLAFASVISKNSYSLSNDECQSLKGDLNVLVGTLLQRLKVDSQNREILERCYNGCSPKNCGPCSDMAKNFGGARQEINEFRRLAAEAQIVYDGQCNK